MKRTLRFREIKQLHQCHLASNGCAQADPISVCCQSPGDSSQFSSVQQSFWFAWRGLWCKYTAKTKDRGCLDETATHIQAYPGKCRIPAKLFEILKIVHRPPLLFHVIDTFKYSEKSVGSEIENHLLSPVLSRQKQFDCQQDSEIDICARTQKAWFPAFFHYWTPGKVEIV